MVAVDRFLRTVARSGVLERDELDEIVQKAPPSVRAESEALADYLIRMGHLSRFQARKLLKGRSAGLVLGEHQIITPIARGGMSRVYLGKDSVRDKLVALKVLAPHKARKGDRYLARFLREMEMGQRIAHPHLVGTLDVGVRHGVFYIVLEYISGKNLYRAVREHGPLSVPKAASLFAQIASALDHLHQHGMVHRDLKPSNILIDTNDHAWLLDLGLSLVQGEPTIDRTIVGGRGYLVGSIDYMAPEQAEDATSVDGRADIYGLGCTLYFALTGRQPFGGGTKRQKILKHRLDEVVPLTQFNPAVPNELAILVQVMMAKSPNKRPPSATAVRNHLLAWAR